MLHNPLGDFLSSQGFFFGELVHARTPSFPSFSPFLRKKVAALTQRLMIIVGPPPFSLSPQTNEAETSSFLFLDRVSGSTDFSQQGRNLSLFPFFCGYRRKEFSRR